MNSFKRYRILRKFKLNYKDLSIELVYNSSFELLIAVLLSAQTSDNQVNKVTQSLFKKADTPDKMILLGEQNIKSYIKSIGLFNIKAKNIILTCNSLLKNFNGIVPNNRADLESLPGVGRKTANIILNIIFDYSTIAVDRHVFRFCNRSRFAVGKNVKFVEKKLLTVVPKKFKKNCHQWIVNHCKSICLAKNPKCYKCFIQDLCEFQEKNFFRNLFFNGI